MRTIKVQISTNVIGSACVDEFEVEDDATEEEINKEAREIAFDMMDWTWWEEE